MKANKYKIDREAPLNDLDTPEQTFGCRCYNPDICKYNECPNLCAFVTTDHICRKPSKTWHKQYLKLKETT